MGGNIFSLDYLWRTYYYIYYIIYHDNKFSFVANKFVIDAIMLCFLYCLLLEIYYKLRVFFRECLYV